MKRLILKMCVISTVLSITSCSSTEDDPTANLPVCDCIELEPQRDAQGERINGREHIMYKSDSLYTGKCVTYHLDNTTKKVELIFQNGLLHGLQQHWDDNGNKVMEAPMSQGQFHGTFKEWDENQHLISKMEFKGNKVVESGYKSYLNDKKERHYTISTQKEPYDVGYYYPTFFQNQENQYGNIGFGTRISSGMEALEISGTGVYSNVYKIRIKTDVDKIDKKQVESILNEFHKENPTAILNIEGFSWGYGGYIDANTNCSYCSKFSNGESNTSPINDSIINYFNSFKSFKFLKIHPDIDKYVEESKEYLRRKGKYSDESDEYDDSYDEF